MGAQGGHRGHGGSEIFGLHRGGDRRLGLVEGGEEGAFLLRLGEFEVRAEGIFDAVLRFRLGQDVVRPLEALQQVRPVLGLHHRRQRLGPFDQKRQVVIPRHGKAGVDDVVPDALVLEEDFQAVVEEGEEVGDLLSRYSISPFGHRI